MRASWWLLLTLCCPFQALAAEPAPLARADAAYADLDFEKALGLLDEALQKSGNSREALVRIHHLRGLCLGSLGRYDEAREAFARLLSLEPAFRLGSDVSPRVRAPFQRLMEEGLPRLEVAVVPPPAASPGKPLELLAQVKQDSVGMARSLQVWFRRGEAGGFSSVLARLRGAGDYRVSVPTQLWGAAGTGEPLFWHAMLQDEYGGELQRFGSELNPFPIEIGERPELAEASEETPWYREWWVWTLVGGVVLAGTATALALTLTRSDSGPYDFQVTFE